MAHGRTEFLAIILLLLQLTPAHSSQWPLEGYEPGCGLLRLDGLQPVDKAAIAHDSDADLLWVVDGLTLKKFRYSTGVVLERLSLLDPGES